MMYKIKFVFLLTLKFLYDLVFLNTSFFLKTYKLFKKRHVNSIIKTVKFTGTNILNENSYLIKDFYNNFTLLTNSKFRSNIGFSIIVPVFNTPLKYLKYCLKSITNQFHDNYELIIVNDGSTNLDILQFLDSIKSKKNIKLINKSKNEGISKACNTALKVAKKEFFFVVDHDDALSVNALPFLASTLINNPCDYLYTDEDKINEQGYRFGPFYKPDWSPEYLLSMMYTCHLSVYRTSIAKKINGFNSEFDGAQDYDFLLRFLLETKKIYHLDKILYHWRAWSNSTAQNLDAKPQALINARKALRSYLISKNENFVIKDNKNKGHFSVDFFPKKKSLVSIVIPTANFQYKYRKKIYFHLNEVLDSIIDNTNYENYEIIVVHNGNLLSNQIKKLDKLNISSYLYKFKNFNLSEKINFGVEKTKGEYILILNDDIRISSKNKDWLHEMLGMAQREGVGAVGSKLLFPNKKIQHSGIVIINNLPGHHYYKFNKSHIGYGLNASVNTNFIAVTGACLMTSKKLFDSVGGFDNDFAINYNDVDFCLKLHMKKFRSVVLNSFEHIHFEGVSKAGGRTTTLYERNLFIKRWKHLIPNDPYYNRNLSKIFPFNVSN